MVIWIFSNHNQREFRNNGWSWSGIIILFLLGCE